MPAPESRQTTSDGEPIRLDDYLHSDGSAPWRIYNIGCEQPVDLLRYIEVIERNLQQWFRHVILLVYNRDLNGRSGSIANASSNPRG